MLTTQSVVVSQIFCYLMKIAKHFFSAMCFLILSISGNGFVRGQEDLISAQGIVEQITIEDKTVRYDYVLAADNGKRYRLNASQPLTKYINRRVTVSGLLHGNQLKVTYEIKTVEENLVNLSPPPPTFGSRKVLVLLVKFINSPAPSITEQQVRSNIFTGANSANSYFKEASYYRFNLTGIERADGDVVGWLTLPIPYTSGVCDIYTDWTERADALARQNGYDPNNYNSAVYVFPNFCAGGIAAGDMGVLGGSTTVKRVWLGFGVVNDTSTIVHEIGHNLGLDHANAYACTGTNIPISCQSIEYGDPFDTMGLTRFLFFFNNYYRLALGWLNGRTQVITTSGDYTLLPPSVPTKGNQVLQIPLKPPGSNSSYNSYLLEFRRPVSFDNAYPRYNSQPVYNGVSIRYGLNEPLGIATHLMDGTPNTPTFYDAALAPGNTFTDTMHGVTITTLSINPVRGARVRVQLSQ